MMNFQTYKKSIPVISEEFRIMSFKGINLKGNIFALFALSMIVLQFSKLKKTLFVF